MDAHDPELKRELDATLQARKELGAEYESELIDAFLEKVQQRFNDTADRDLRRQQAERQMAAARGARPYAGGDGEAAGVGLGERFAFVGVSLVLAIPLSAIGAVNAGESGLLITWAGIVGVNAVHSLGFFSRFRREHREHRK
ncbi:hypothetical protein [Streptomyces botrytidirepellens]|uniref:Integral membrane protein n=1 Tax=Streptomyces botrytidirepellens TaxID=2486417 RepID=A0A3M8W7V4_9ACTN|nr:hypothetical protein [Streptomyces botrytidirepellens]RNG26188.1 hypothetical protein EEJ42_15825 [Streptomyces botrytidirepellens]